MSITIPNARYPRAAKAISYTSSAGFVRRSRAPNDGIISTARLIVGVVTTDTPSSIVLLTGTAALVAGAIAMAAGEYVSVSS